MQKAISFSLVALAAVLLSGCDTPSAPPPAPTQKVQETRIADLMIQNVTVIDALNGVRENQSIVIDDGVLSYVGTQTDQLAQTTVDGTGKFVIPGLWDAHVHLSFEPELDDAMFNLLVANGITSVRDTGGELDKVVEWKKKSKTELAPDVYIAGPLIDGKPAVYLGEVKGFPKIGIEVDTKAKVVETVDALAEAGVDLLKAYEMLSPDAYVALLERAKHHGLPVTGHVPLSMSAAEVSNLGLTSMEHLRNLEMDCSTESEGLLEKRIEMLKNEDQKPGSKLRSEIHAAQHFPAAASYDPDRCAQLISVFAKNKTWQIPTLTLMLASKVPYYAQDEWRATFVHLPSSLRDNWLTSTERFKKVVSTPNPGRENRKVVADWKVRMVKDMSDAGIPIMAGTDMPIFYLTPGFSLHRELETLVSAGLTPMQALEAATLNPAKYFSKQDTLGSIDVNKVADLVLLSANPLADIKNTTKIDSVIRNGQLLDRARLDSMLNAASK